MSPLDWVECNVLHSWLLGSHPVMHLCWTGLESNLLQHKHSWKLFEDTNQWLNVAIEEYQLIWQSLSMEWNCLQDNTSSGGPEKSLFCLVIAGGYAGLGRPLFRNLVKHMEEHCQKQKERRPLFLGRILLSTTQMLPKDINSVPSTRHCWLDAEHHTILDLLMRWSAPYSVHKPLLSSVSYFPATESLSYHTLLYIWVMFDVHNLQDR